MTQDRFESIEQVIEALAKARYIADRALASVLFLACRLNKPLFLEGEPGVGKTELGVIMADLFETRLIRLQCYEGLDANHALDSRWHVVNLLLDARPYPGAIPYRNSWLNTSYHYSDGYAVLYTIALIPGRHYTLGLACPAYARDVAVVLFDRWPAAAGARMYSLPMGPRVRSNPRRVEYRWRCRRT